MAKEYIEREALTLLAYKSGDYGHPAVVDLEDIANVPAADVAPVVHGRWKSRPMIVNTTRLEVWMCSVCGVEKTRTSIYCPNCGAKMEDGE